MSDNEIVEEIKGVIRSFPDFPKKGILFYDIHPILLDHKHRNNLAKYLAERYKGKIDVIVGIESRGYYFGLLVAHLLEIPFVPIRKAGKLPGVTVGLEYGLEYGKDKIEIQIDSIKEGDRVAVIDDLMATGGTMSAACELLQNIKAEIVECHCLIELVGLKGREKLPKDVNFYSLIQFD